MNILLKRLSAWLGLIDSSLTWIQSYITYRSFSVRTSETLSRSYPLACGVPQGSVLGSLIFIFYTTLLSSLIKSPSVDHYLSADDTKLFMAFSPGSFSESIDHLLHVVKHISSWLTSHSLCLNPSTTEHILTGLCEQLKKISSPSISFNLDSASTHTFTPNSPLGNLLDQNRSFSDHITNLSRSYFMHSREESALRSIIKLHLSSLHNCPR